MDASQKAIYPPESITLLKSFFDSPRFLKSLQRILHLTPAVDDGLLFGFYKSRALFEFTKFTEWEMDIDVGQEMLVAYRDIDAEKKKEEASSNGGGIKNESSSSSLAADTVAAVAATKIITATTDSTKSSTLFTTATSSASPSLSSTSSPSTSSNNNNNNNSQVPRLAPASNNLERWVSIDEDLLGDEEDDEGSKSNPAASDGSGGEQDSNFTTDDIDMKLFLDPDPNIFASQLREFVEYQKVYGEGWITVVAMRVFARRNKNGDDSHWKIGVQMCDLGLVPVQYIQKEK